MEAHIIVRVLLCQESHMSSLLSLPARGTLWKQTSEDSTGRKILQFAHQTLLARKSSVSELQKKVFICFTQWQLCASFSTVLTAVNSSHGAGSFPTPGHQPFLPSPALGFRLIVSVYLCLHSHQPGAFISHYCKSWQAVKGCGALKKIIMHSLNTNFSFTSYNQPQLIRRKVLIIKPWGYESKIHFP